MKALGRKQQTDNSDWLMAVEKIESVVPESQIEQLVRETVNDIQVKTAGLKAAFAWSGGKDSLVLERLCQMAGINECVLVISDLEYPAFMQWVRERGPENLEIINTHQDLEWLSKHQKMLFPQDSATAAKWFHIVQHRGQAKYYNSHNLDIMILGRRRADGNYVGKGSNIYTNAQGVTRFSPLSDWTHEEILAFIHYNNISLPPFYEWKNGFYCGTHPWPARQWTKSTENGWNEVYDIDHSIVEQAARYIDSAAEFLKGKEAVR